MWPRVYFSNRQHFPTRYRYRERRGRPTASLLLQGRHISFLFPFPFVFSSRSRFHRRGEASQHSLATFRFHYIADLGGVGCLPRVAFVVLSPFAAGTWTAIAIERPNRRTIGTKLSTLKRGSRLRLRDSERASKDEEGSEEERVASPLEHAVRRRRARGRRTRGRLRSLPFGSEAARLRGNPGRKRKRRSARGGRESETSRNS